MLRYVLWTEEGCLSIRVDAPYEQDDAFLLRPVLKLAKARLEVDTYSEDASGINQSLTDVPQHTIGDVVVVEEEREESQHNSAHHHCHGCAVLNPFFCV